MKSNYSSFPQKYRSNKVKFLLFYSLMVLLIVALLLTSCQVTESTVSNASKSESQIKTDNISKITSIIESNPNSDISKIDEISEVSEEPVDMPVGVSIVDGKYYLNFEGGNDYIPGKDIKIDCSDIIFKDASEFKRKVKALDFTEEEFTIMKTFQKNKYGIKFINPDSICSPVGVPKNLKLDRMGYHGGEYYSFAYVESASKNLMIHLKSREDADSHSNYIENELKIFEDWSKNGTISNLQKSSESVDGVDTQVLSYTTKYGNKRVAKLWEFTVNGIKYGVQEYYIADETDPEFNLDVPKFFVVKAINEEHCFSIEGVGFAPDTMFLSGLGMELVE